MDNNWCGAEDGRLADQEDYENFKKKVVSAIRGMQNPTLQAVKEKVGAWDMSDVRYIAMSNGYDLPWK